MNHRMVMKRMEVMADAIGKKWISCPGADVNREDSLICVKGRVDYGRGPRDCSLCDGAGKVLVNK